MLVGDVQAVVSIEGQACWSVQLSGRAASLAPVIDYGAGRVESGHHVLVLVADVNVPLAVLGYRDWPDELAGIFAELGEGAVVLAVDVVHRDADAANVSFE